MIAYYILLKVAQEDLIYLILEHNLRFSLRGCLFTTTGEKRNIWGIIINKLYMNNVTNIYLNFDLLFSFHTVYLYTNA